METRKKKFIPRPFKMPWGKGFIVEEARYRSRYHEPAIQLMEYDDGTFTIRFAYYRGGRFQRSPLLLDPAEAAKLRSKIQKCPRLKKFLKKLI